MQSQHVKQWYIVKNLFSTADPSLQAHFIHSNIIMLMLRSCPVPSVRRCSVLRLHHCNNIHAGKTNTDNCYVNSPEDWYERSYCCSAMQDLKEKEKRKHVNLLSDSQWDESGWRRGERFWDSLGVCYTPVTSQKNARTASHTHTHAHTHTRRVMGCVLLCVLPRAVFCCFQFVCIFFLKVYF